LPQDTTIRYKRATKGSKNEAKGSTIDIEISREEAQAANSGSGVSRDPFDQGRGWQYTMACSKKPDGEGERNNPRLVIGSKLHDVVYLSDN
jgi:hypothetical protein